MTSLFFLLCLCTLVASYGSFNRCAACNHFGGSERCCCEGSSLTRCSHGFASNAPLCYDPFAWNCCGCTTQGVCGVCEWDETCQLISPSLGFRCVQPGGSVIHSQPNFLMYIGIAMGAIVVLCIFSLAIRACVRSSSRGTVYYQTVPQQPPAYGQSYGQYAQPQQQPYGYNQQQQPPPYGRPPPVNPTSIQ